MINDAVWCQDVAVKHILVSKQAKLGVALQRWFVLILLELQSNCEYVLRGTS